MRALANRCLAAFAFSLLFNLCIHAQVAGGQGNITRLDLGGGNSIDGLILRPEGGPMGDGPRITLSRAGFVASVYADEYGRFRVTGLNDGSYILTVEAADDIEPQSQQVDISVQRTGLPQSYSVTFRMRYKKGIATKPGVLEADLAGVPKSAIEAYQKAAVAAAKAA